MTNGCHRSPLDQTAEIGVYRFGTLRWLTTLARWQVRNCYHPVPLSLDLGRPDAVRPGSFRSGPGYFFSEICLNYGLICEIVKFIEYSL
jgi:hypothetical protein